MCSGGPSAREAGSFHLENALNGVLYESLHLIEDGVIHKI